MNLFRLLAKTKQMQMRLEKCKMRHTPTNLKFAGNKPFRSEEGESRI